MTTIMDDQTTFYPVPVYSRAFPSHSSGMSIRNGQGARGGQTKGFGRHFHGFQNQQAPAYYHACAERPGNVNGQTMSVIERLPPPLDAILPACSQRFMHQQHHPVQQSHTEFNGTSSSDIHTGRQRHHQHHSSIHHHQHHQQNCFQRAGTSNIIPSNSIDTWTQQPIHPISTVNDSALTFSSAHVPGVCVQGNLHTDHHSLATTLQMVDSQPTHVQSIEASPPPAVIASPTVDKHRQQQPLPFPWMKTTKSHAHQWKAHWSGK